ncbi:MAG: sigma-54-dependent Fis family transcriptional regulator [Calditrichaeota bacterium]|nr:sigma-54-dependent Fis family transcriptional regulator [Calditrichota bacterium]
MDTLLNRIMDIAMKTLNAERGFMLLRNRDHSRGFEAAVARNIGEEAIASIKDLSTSVVNQVIESGEPVLTFDARTDERFSDARSVILQQIRSIACVPMSRTQEVVGAIYMDTRSNSEQFSEAGLLFLEAFARQSAIALDNIQTVAELKTENKRLKRQIDLSAVFPEIIGESRPIQEILEMIEQIADSSASVLIEGESGTGKELVARALHVRSRRADKLFIPVFCGGLNENLLESELFGHKKGAFTGASENKAGLFEEADGGTVFLDEIGDINANVQTKLLRVIQEGEVKRVGENVTRKVNVRVISATNKDLWEEVQKKNFREDLYYRLNVINVKMPPLRDRQDDVKLLANHFLERFARVNGKKVRGFSPGAIKAMLEYPWPGNIRELENAVERAIILAREPVISADLFSNLKKNRASDLVGRSLKDVEKSVITQTLEMTGNHRTRAAEVLGVSRRWLQYRIKEYGIDAE